MEGEKFADDIICTAAALSDRGSSGGLGHNKRLPHWLRVPSQPLLVYRMTLGNSALDQLLFEPNMVATSPVAVFRYSLARAVYAIKDVPKNGKTDVIANDSGDRVTPTIVSYTNCDLTVGVAAKQSLLNNAANTVFGVKRLLGKVAGQSDIDDVIKDSPVKVAIKDNALMFNVTYKEKPHQCSPIDVASIIYKKMKETAESHGGAADAHDAVITVPLDFDANQREASKQAATRAGFNVLRVINEPTAAVLAYNIGQTDTSEICNVLVFRLGGQSLDVTVVQCISGMYRVAASCSNRSVGGHMLDVLLVEHFASEFQRTTRTDCRGNKRSIGKLLLAAENCKHILSTLGVAQCSVESLYEGIDFNCGLSRSRLEGLASSFFQKCLEPFNDVLSQAELTSTDIHKVIMCGGCSKIPLLQQQVQELFSSATLLTSIPSDEVIAVGAAVQASLLSGHDQNELDRFAANTRLPSLAADILVQVNMDDTKFVTIFKSLTPIPIRRQKKFILSPSETSVCLRVMQQSRDNASMTSLAVINLTELPAGGYINTVFHVRHDGSLHVTCSEPVTSQSRDVMIEAAE